MSNIRDYISENNLKTKRFVGDVYRLISPPCRQEPSKLECVASNWYQHPELQIIYEDSKSFEYHLRFVPMLLILAAVSFLSYAVPYTFTGDRTAMWYYAGELCFTAIGAHVGFIIITTTALWNMTPWAKKVVTPSGINTNLDARVSVAVIVSFLGVFIGALADAFMAAF